MMEEYIIVKDEEASTTSLEILRGNLLNEEDVGKWMKQYCSSTNTSWIVDAVRSNCERMVFHKVWRCQHHGRNKRSSSSQRVTGCTAKLDVKIKKTNRNTKGYDEFLRRDVPLPAVMKIDSRHNHSTQSADALRLLRSTPEAKATFLEYFNEGMTAANAKRLHESKLAVEVNGAELLANAAINPTTRTVNHWYETWRKDQYGGREAAFDPILKLKEKSSRYKELGITLECSQSEDSSLWAILIVTPIMRRLQGKETAAEVIFIDSTSSCDSAHSTVTVLLTGTNWNWCSAYSCDTSQCTEH
ncbi:uncharacterized protein LOC135400417 [Ornithodoros turicata]|uniref:uncharacterized protein LOC135400417 n=1 Tax=Ornithodoros turicata TaxID=34597 RepID=UPI00313962DD